MFLNRTPVKILYKSKHQQGILERLSDYVDSNMKEPMEILARLWEDQKNAVSYQEIREAVLSGEMDEEYLEEWRQDYAIMAALSFTPIWMQAAEAGGRNEPVTAEIKGFQFNKKAKGLWSWLSEHSGEFITAVTEEQRAAVRAMIGRAVDGKYTVDELARVIRPCIGLNRTQAEANLRFYESVRDNLISQHPRMKAENAQKQVREMAVKYAERQHRQRAYMIAETELVAAYNQGAEQAVRQAQQQGRLGAVLRIGSTADDERVCIRCAAKHGKELPMEEGTPPWHPRCRCAIAYEPTEEAVDPESVAEPDYLRMEDNVPEKARDQILKEWDLIPPEHQAILEREIVGIWRSPFGVSRTDKRYGLVYVEPELVEGEFVHEAAHILENVWNLFEDSEYLKILKDSLGEYRFSLILDTETFEKPIYRVCSDKLVTEYQGRYYESVPIEKEDGSINPYAFSDFFAEGYRAYIFFPEKLKQKNRELYDYIGGIGRRWRK